MASQLNNYGVLCKYWGRFPEGERGYLRAFEILEAFYGVESLDLEQCLRRVLRRAPSLLVIAHP